ncbi:MAG TPA: hypothetical protein VG013_15170 [Gemmataceae bacterium]|nr:hypothetical protein [Gemmataceae bacterium]
MFQKSFDASGLRRWLGVGLAALLVAGWTAAKEPAPSRASDSRSRDAHAKPRDAQAESPPERLTAPKLELKGRGIEDGMRDDRQRNEWEFKAYCDALITAHYTPQEAFANSARRDLAYVHLFEQTHLYRGTVVHQEGRLKRLRKFDAPDFTWSQGVRDVYEGWLFDPKIRGANPLCVYFTDLPPGLKVGEEIEHRVSFDGYLFKRFRYKADDGHLHECPLLIGHTVVLQGAETGAPESLSQMFIWSFLGLLGLTVAVVVGLASWYRRGDRQVRTRVIEASAGKLSGPAFEEGGLGEGQYEDARPPDEEFGTHQ